MTEPIDWNEENQTMRRSIPVRVEMDDDLPNPPQRDAWVTLGFIGAVLVALVVLSVLVFPAISHRVGSPSPVSPPATYPAPPTEARP